MKSRFHKTIAKVLASAMLGTMFLTGCADVIPELSDEQQKEIGEFAAVTLMKYDANNRSRLVDRRFVRGVNGFIEEEPEQNQDEAPQAQDHDTETPSSGGAGEKAEPQYQNMAEFLGLAPGISLTFTGIEYMDSYLPAGMSSSFFALDASEGKVLAVLEFVLSNHSDSGQEVNILSMNPVFKAIYENAGTKNVLATLLETDLSTYKKTLAAGESENVVLLTEIDRGTENGTGSIKLQVRYGENNATFTLIP